MISAFNTDYYGVQQFLPVTGWRILLGWVKDGEVKTAVSHVLAWAIGRHREDSDQIEIFPVTPHPFEDHRFFTWEYSGWGIASALIQPGENPTPQQMEFVKDYAIDLEKETQKHMAACQKARVLRRAGDSIEHIAEVTELSRDTVRDICRLVDEDLRRERGDHQ